MTDVPRCLALRRWLAWVVLAALLLPPLSLAPYMVSSTEVVKLRNAALLQDDLGPAFDWSAPPPAEFAFDQAPFDPYFVDIAQRLALGAQANDWDRAVVISRHLLGSHAPLLGGPVQADLRHTHAAITQRGEGYCADFVRVFMAIASAAGMPVRAWAFSFDGFGGHGHVFIEIWNRQALRWQLVDLFNNYYFAVDEDAPLSAAEFRQMMASAPQSLRMLALDARAQPGWAIRAKALDYYQRGLDEWYLMWGSNVLAVERAASFRAFKPLSFQLANVGAVAQGVYPGVRPLPTPGNAARIEALRRTRVHLFVAATVMAIGAVFGIAWLLSLRGRSKPGGVEYVG